AAPLLPRVDLAQPAVALRGVRAKIIGHEGDAAPCRRVSAGAQSRKPRNAGRRDQCRGTSAQRRRNGAGTLWSEGRMSDTAEILEQAARWRETGQGVALA